MSVSHVECRGRCGQGVWRSNSSRRDPLCPDCKAAREVEETIEVAGVRVRVVVVLDDDGKPEGIGVYVNDEHRFGGTIR